jgi:hypothetical protein
VEIRGVLELRGACGVSPGDIADGRVRYNALVHDLRAAAAAPGLDEAGAVGLARDFVAAVRTLPVAGRASVPEVLAELESIAGSGAGPPPVDVTRIGPGTVAGWSGTALTPDGSWVRYTPGPGVPTKRTLEFVRIESPPASPGEPVAAVYLCTTETPLGLAVDLSADPSIGAGLTALLPPGERAGPVGWQIEDGRLSLARAWVGRFPGGSSDADYAELLIAGFPGPDHPLQHVCPGAAMFLAHALGCRLPTSAEWRAARVKAAPPSIGAWNLRDERWRRQWASADAVQKRGRVALWPDAATFWPSPAPDGLGRAAASGPHAQAAFDGDDGFLFFAPGSADAGAVLQHVVGNTAEYVFEDTRAFEELADGSAAGVQGFAQATAGRLGVVGGSALSAPQLETDRTWSVDLFDVQDRVGYADVGFRLAFSAGGPSAPRLSAAARMLTRLTDEAYLTP